MFSPLGPTLVPIRTYAMFFFFFMINFLMLLCLPYYTKTFKLCSNFELFHQEIKKLKTVFENNGYPKCFVDLYIKKSLDKVFIKKGVVLKA